MSGSHKCPACVIRVVDPGGPGEWRDPSCTGRPGCVRAEMEEMIQRAEAAGWTFSYSIGGVDIVEHPDRENPAPESGPAGADVPDGKEVLTDEDRMAAEWAALAEGPGPLGTTPKMSDLRREYGKHLTRRPAKDAEIARLRAEVERLTEELAAQTSDTTEALDALAVEMADRADLGARVAEAVRCGALLVVDLRDRARIRAMDLGPIVAAAIKEGE
jgi:hypothetical protein